MGNFFSKKPAASPFSPINDSAASNEQKGGNRTVLNKIIFTANAIIMVAVSTAGIYFTIETIRHQGTDPDNSDEYGLHQKQMQLATLYALLSGIAFQVSLNLLPVSSSIRTEINKVKSLTIPMEFAILYAINGIFHPAKTVGNKVCSRELRKILLPWGSFRYGIVLTDLAMNFFIKIKKHRNSLQPLLERETLWNSNKTGSYDLQTQAEQEVYIRNLLKYKSPLYGIVMAIAAAGITIPYNVNLSEKIEPITGYYLKLVISGLGYGSAGFFLGDILENVSNTSRLNFLHELSFHVYGFFLKPGPYYYNAIFMSLAGIIAGWSTAYSRRQINSKKKLMQKQIELLQILLAPQHQPIRAELEKIALSIKEQEDISNKKRRRFKLPLFGGIIPVPILITILGKDIFIGASSFGMYVAIGTYYLSQWLIANKYTPKKIHSLSLLLNSNIILLSEINLLFIFALIKSIVFGITEDPSYAGGYQFGPPAGFSLGILVGTSFTAFFNGSEIQEVMDKEKLSHFLSLLNNTSESSLPLPVSFRKEDFLFIFYNILQRASVEEPEESEAMENISSSINRMAFFIAPPTDTPKNFQASAVQSGLLLPFVTHEFSIRTAYETRFRF